MPQVIISDRGTVFVSKFMKDLYDLLQIKGNFSTAYHPRQTDKPNGLIRKSKSTFECSSIISKLTGQNGFPLLHLPTITENTLPLVKVYSRSITDIILPYYREQTCCAFLHPCVKYLRLQDARNPCHCQKVTREGCTTNENSI